MRANEIVHLVRRAAAGDRSAYGEVVKRFRRVVYSVALARLRNESDANDLTQEVFVRAMTRLEQLRDPAHFPGWIRRITDRLALNRLTRRGPVRPAATAVLDTTPDSNRLPIEELQRAERCHATLAGLKRLKPRDRATLEAFYYRDLSVREMAREFGVPIGTIKRRLYQARERLRRVLEKQSQRDTVLITGDD
ncbi:MAG: hypothetical protein KatS3mg105_0785 [Gemmatales bacterium]|nr:MAG: hypothetical protein KatS3mg105_0785 [Gemmatales bacterium]